jgi:hypothetical protein
MHLPSISGFNYYFQFTINGYGKALEPNAPSNDESIQMFRQLSELIGPARTIWRYDPILFTKDYSIEWHIAQFGRISRALTGRTHKCVISFLDLYRKTERNLLGVPILPMNRSMMFDLSSAFAQQARDRGIELNTCAEEIDLSSMGITPGKCIDDKLIEEISSLPLNVKKDKHQRQECGCVASIDIGSYNTCPHGCLYCYANYSAETVKKNYAQHDSDSPLLFGNIHPEDTIKERKVSSCFEQQQRLL